MKTANNTSAPDQKARHKSTFRADPAWWAWAIVALMALLPLHSAFA